MAGRGRRLDSAPADHVELVQRVTRVDGAGRKDPAVRLMDVVARRGTGNGERPVGQELAGPTVAAVQQHLRRREIRRHPRVRRVGEEELGSPQSDGPFNLADDLTCLLSSRAPFDRLCGWMSN